MMVNRVCYVHEESMELLDKGIPRRLTVFGVGSLEKAGEFRGEQSYSPGLDELTMAAHTRDDLGHGEQR